MSYVQQNSHIYVFNPQGYLIIWSIFFGLGLHEKNAGLPAYVGLRVM